MEATNLKDKSFNDPEIIQIEKIKTDLFNAREVIEMLDFFVEKRQIDRIKAWFPDLKQAVAELEIHINGNQSG